MNICDGLTLNGTRCSFRTKGEKTRCKIHEGLFFCGEALLKNKRCGIRVQEGQKCPNHQEGTQKPQATNSDESQTRLIRRLQRDNFELRRSIKVKEQSLQDAEQDAKQEIQKYQFRTQILENSLQILQPALSMFMSAIETNQRTPDRAPVRFVFGDDVLYLQTCAHPERYKDQTGFGFFRRIPEPDPARRPASH